MATLYITEFQNLGTASGGTPQLAAMPPIAEQTRTFTGTSAQSSAFSAQTRYVRLHTDAICSILIGANPTALLTSARLAADQTEYFGVQPGDKIAAIANT